MNLSLGKDTHYWTDTNGLNIFIGSCYREAERCSRESISRFISGIFMQEFPDMEPENARTFGNDLAEEIIGTGNIEIGDGKNRRIKIEWSSMALVFLYKETRPDEAIPISIDDRYYNISKKR